MVVEEASSVQVPPIIEAKAKGMRIWLGFSRLFLHSPSTAGRKTAVVVVLWRNAAMQAVAGISSSSTRVRLVPAILEMVLPKHSIAPVLISAPESTKSAARTITMSLEKPANASRIGSRPSSTSAQSSSRVVTSTGIFSSEKQITTVSSSARTRKIGSVMAPGAAGRSAQQQARRVVAEDAGALELGDRQRADRVQHLRDAADLVRVVAAGEEVVGAGESQGQLERAGIEVHRVEVEPLEDLAGRPSEMDAALAEGVEPAVEPLGQVGDGAAQVAQHPADAGEPFGDAAEHQLGRGERGVEQEAHQRHQPVLGHRLDAHRVGGVDVEHRAEAVRRFVQRPEARVGQRHAVDVAEQHGAAEAELGAGALELAHRRGGIVERQRRERGEAPALVADHRGEGVVDQAGQPHRLRRRLHVGPGSGQAQHLGVHPQLLQQLLAVVDVVVAADGDVVVARVVQARVALGVDGDPHIGVAGAQRVEVRRRVEVVVAVDHGHGRKGTSGVRGYNTPGMSMTTEPGSGSVSLGLPLGEGPKSSAQAVPAPRPKGGRGKRTHYPEPRLPGSVPPPRRWPWAVALLAVVLLAVAVVWIPAWTMRPSLPQSAAAMSRAYALRRLAPAATLAALGAGAALAWRLWRSTRWAGRALAVAALLPLAAAAWFSRQNHFEWLVPPLPPPGYEPAAAALSFVEPGGMVLAVQVQGEAAAYPVRQIAFHHVVEDVVGGTPLAVTY